MGREVRVTIVGDAAQFERTLQRADRSMDRVGRGAARLQTALAAGLAGGAVVRGVEQVVKTTTEFDTSMRQVSAVSDASGRDLQKLEGIARETGLQVGTGARAAAEGQVELAKAGLGVRDIGPALKSTLQMAQAGSLGTAEAANAAANALNTFNLKGSETSKVADALANAANLTTADVGDFALALSQGGSAAQLLGMDLTDTVTVLTELAQIGIKGSDAGTSLKAAMLQVSSPTREAAAAMDEYNLRFFDAKGRIKDVADISQMLRRQLGGLTREQQVQVLKTVAGSDGFRTFAAMMRHTGAESRELSRELTRQGSAARTAAEMQSGLQGQWNRLRASGEELQLSVGERLAPRIGELADKLAELAADPETADQILQMVDSAVETGERLWEVAEPAARGVATLAQAIAELPAPIQQTMLQLLALSAIAGKVRGAAGLTGLTNSTRAMRRELAAVPGDAARAQAALASGLASGPAAAGQVARARVARAPQQVVQVPEGRFGATGVGALQMRAMSTSEVEEHVRAAQREQSAAARAAVQARRGLAQAELAEIAAQRQAIASRAVPRTAENAKTRAAEVAAAEQRLTAAQRARAAAVENVAASTAESRAARDRLRNARQIEQQAARERTAAAANVPAADPTRRQRLAAAMRGRMPQPSARGGAMILGAGVVGGAMSGGNVATGALSGAALGSMAGPWGIAGGAVLGAASTAVIKEIQQAKTDRVEAASKKFAARVQQATQRGVNVGMSDPQAGARASATLREGQAIKRQLERAMKDRDFGGIRAAQDRARAAGLDPAALLKGNSKALEQAGRDAHAAFVKGLRSTKYYDARGLMDRFAATFAGTGKAAQKHGADAMLSFARELEKQGRAPRGTVERLARDLDRRFGGLADDLGKSGGKAAQAVDKALNDRKLIGSTDKLVTRLSGKFSQIKDIPVKTLPGAVATLGSSLRQLERIARDRNAPKEIRAAAERELPKARKEYDRALKRMADRMGTSKEEAKAWADAVTKQAARAGRGGTDVDTLTDAVEALKASMSGSKSTAESLKAGYEAVGVTAENAAKLVRDYQRAVANGPLTSDGNISNAPRIQSPDEFFATRKRSSKKRRGGPIRLQTGGLVPALMSGGEEYLPPDVAAQYPPGMLEQIEQLQAPHFARGGRVARYGLGGVIIPGPSDRDATPVLAEPGAFVLTGHGQQLRDEMLGYRGGGKVRRAKVGYTVFDDDPPGAFGSLTNGYAELGTATKGGRGTGVGWLARALGMSGELDANTPLTVQIGQRSAVLRKRDRGYGQGSDPNRSDPRWALDVWRDSWAKLGLNRNSKGTATVSLGKGGENDQTYTTTERRSVGRSKTRGGILDDAVAAGIQAVETYGSRRAARLQGAAPVVGQIRDGLEQLKDSYTRRREYTVPGRERRGGRGGVSGATPRVQSMADWAADASKKHPKYVYGGGHGELGQGPFDCSGYVSGILGAGRFIGRPMTTDGLKTFGESGAGEQITIGVRGSTGRQAHTMVQVGNTFWEAGRRGVGRRSGWVGSFPIKRHPKGYRRGGTIGDRLPPAARQALQRPGALDPSSPDFVGQGLRRGGRVQRFAGGGKVRPTRAMSTALSRVQGSTSTAALTGLQAALEGAALEQVEAMRRDLLRRVRAGGDAQATARLRAALDVVVVDLAGRLQERLVRVGDLGGDWERKTGESQHWMRRTGVEDGSARGIQIAQTNAQTYLRSQSGSELRVANAAIADARRLLRTATSDEARATARGKLDEAQGEKQRILDGRTEARTVIEEMARQLPRALATERVQQLDLNDAWARVQGRSPDTDAGALAARQAELQTQLQQAIAARDSGWQLEVLQSLSGVQDSVRALPAQQAARDAAKFDFAAAVAALTETTDDDRQVLAEREAATSARAEAAIARMNAAQTDADRDAAQADATTALTELRGIRDELKTSNTAQQERDQRDEDIRTLLQRIAEATERGAIGAERQAAVSAQYLGDRRTGQIPTNVGRRPISSHPGGVARG
jgi:TP901 family phage tail tape measure protein